MYSGIVKNRHSRNIPAVSEEDMAKIYESKVLVVGCGGLGGYSIEYLARMGVGTIKVVDGDDFAESNLNRQLISASSNIGVNKAIAAAERVLSIDPSIDIIPVPEFLTIENAAALMADTDLVIDALDNVEARMILEDEAEKSGLTIIHGAISGWNFQTMLVPPGSGSLHRLYGVKDSDGSQISRVSEAFPISSLPMTPAVCAAIQVSISVRYLTGHDTPLDSRLFIGSLYDLESEIIGFEK